MIVHVISVSGGKDSAATLLLAIRRVGRENMRAIFCDTGNENSAVYEYLSYLEQALDITIDRLKADFTAEIAAKRRFIANDQRIGLRMLAPKELFRAQGFPESYITEWGIDHNGKRITLTKSAQVRMCGNSVCPPLAAALVRANLPEMAITRRAA